MPESWKVSKDMRAVILEAQLKKRLKEIGWRGPREYCAGNQNTVCTQIPIALSAECPAAH